MTNSLPARADINLLKKQAKKLLKKHRSGDADALKTVTTYHPKPESFSGLRDAQLAVARSYGFKGWAELSDAVENKLSEKDKILYCSFCGRGQNEVHKLIAGPDVFICDKCTDLCISIVVEEMEVAAEEEGRKPDEMLKPRDMPHLEAIIREAQEFRIPTRKSKPKKKPTNDDELSISQVFENALDKGFSGVILARHRGDIVLHEAAGFANKGQKTLNTVDTVFTIGSITKQFTSALIMSLQEAGQLNVENTLKDHFSNVPKDKADITIHQLLTHTAGLTSELGADTDAIGRDEYIEFAWADRLLFGPGSKFFYSNVGYSIAAAIVESVTGQSYEAALKKYILEPAMLNETGYLLPDWSNYTLASGYCDGQRIEAMNTWAKDGPYWNLRGNGGLLATAGDLLKWHDVLSGESVLTASSIEAMQGRHVNQYFGSDEVSDSGSFYGYGWVTEDGPSGVVHWHNGGNEHYYAFIGRHVDEDLVIIGLSNEGKEALDSLCRNLSTTIVRAK